MSNILMPGLSMIQAPKSHTRIASCRDDFHFWKSWRALFRNGSFIDLWFTCCICVYQILMLIPQSSPCLNVEIMNEGPNSKKEITSCFKIIFKKLFWLNEIINNIIIKRQKFWFYFLLSSYTVQSKSRKQCKETESCYRKNDVYRFQCKTMRSIVFCNILHKIHKIFFQQDSK